MSSELLTLFIEFICRWQEERRENKELKLRWPELNGTEQRRKQRGSKSEKFVVVSWHSLPSPIFSFCLPLTHIFLFPHPHTLLWKCLGMITCSACRRGWGLSYRFFNVCWRGESQEGGSHVEQAQFSNSAAEGTHGEFYALWWQLAFLLDLQWRPNVFYLPFFLYHKQCLQQLLIPSRCTVMHTSTDMIYISYCSVGFRTWSQGTPRDMRVTPKYGTSRLQTTKYGQFRNNV